MGLTAYKTDVGIKKKVNQDSLIIRKATTEIGEITFISVCDGMGDSPLESLPLLKQ